MSDIDLGIQCFSLLQQAVVDIRLPSQEAWGVCMDELKNTYAENKEWIGWAFGGVGTALVAGVFTYLQKGKDGNIERIVKAAIESHNQKKDAQEVKQFVIPESITMGTSVLLVPSLQELKIPPPLCCLPFIENHKHYGDWVKRGEPLVTYKFIFYEFSNPPQGISKLLSGDPLATATYQLESPVDGLIIDNRNVRTRSVFDISNNQLLTGMFFGLIDEYQSKLPVILLSENEPQWSNYSLNQFLRFIVNEIVSRWDKNFHNSGNSGGYARMRFKTAIEEHRYWAWDEEHRQQLKYALSWVNDEHRETNECDWPRMDIKDYKNTYRENIIEYVEFIRTKNYSDRKKLEHIVNYIKSLT